MLESSWKRPFFEPLSRAGPNGRLRCGRAAPAEAADSAAFDTQVGEQILQKATKSYAKRRRSSETISGFLQWYLRDMVTAYATGKWRPVGRLSDGGTTSAAGTCE